MFIFNVFLQKCTLVAASSHWSQGYLKPSCFILMCFFRSHGRVAANPHWPHGYFIPSSLFSIWIFQFTSVHCNIDTLVTLISNTLVLTFNLSLYFRYLVGLMVTWISHFFIFIFKMLLQISCCRCSVFTLVTLIPHTYMFIFNVFLQIIYTSGSVLTMIARISQTLVLNSDVLLQTTWSGGSKSTLTTSIFHSLKFFFQYESSISSVHCNIDTLVILISNTLVLTFNVSL